MKRQEQDKPARPARGRGRLLGRRSGRVVVALAAALVLGTTVLAIGGTAAIAQSGTGLLRLAHLAPSTPAVDLYVQDEDARPTKVAGDVTYRELSPYLSQPAGTYSVQARPAGSPADSPTLFDVAVEVPTGAAQTAAFVDTYPGAPPQPQVLDDQTAPASPGTAMMRVVQAAAGLGPVDVTVEGGPDLARTLFYGSATPYATMPARTWTLQVRSRQGNATTLTVPVTGTSVSSLVITRKDDGGLAAQVVPDAPSAVATPAPGTGSAPGGTVPVSPAPGGAAGGPDRTEQPPLPGGQQPSQAPDADTERPAVPRVPVPPTGGIEAGGGGLAVRTAWNPLGWWDDEPDVPPAARMAVASATAPAPGGLRPDGLDAPSIGLQAPGIVDLRVDYRGKLQVPTDYGRAGWYTSSAVPGDPGPAVLVGHIDTRRGPAVFGQLDRLRPGDPIIVPRSDGETANFVVDSVEYYAKDELPTERVYGPTTAPTLRLLTCGGPFDEKTLSYRDNVVVFASQR